MKSITRIKVMGEFRSPVLGVRNINIQNSLVITIDNGYLSQYVTTQELDAELVGMVNQALQSGGVATNLTGLNGYTTYVINIDNITEAIAQFLYSKKDKIHIDNFETFNLYEIISEGAEIWNRDFTSGLKKVAWDELTSNNFTYDKYFRRLISSEEYQTYSREQIESMLKDDIIAFIQRIEAKTDDDIVVSGTLKADYVDALCNYLGV